MVNTARAGTYDAAVGISDSDIAAQAQEILDIHFGGVETTEFSFLGVHFARTQTGITESCYKPFTHTVSIGTNHGAETVAEAKIALVDKIYDRAVLVTNGKDTLPEQGPLELRAFFGKDKKDPVCKVEDPEGWECPDGKRYRLVHLTQ